MGHFNQKAPLIKSKFTFAGNDKKTPQKSGKTNGGARDSARNLTIFTPNFRQNFRRCPEFRLELEQRLLNIMKLFYMKIR